MDILRRYQTPESSVERQVKVYPLDESVGVFMGWASLGLWGSVEHKQKSELIKDQSLGKKCTNDISLFFFLPKSRQFIWISKYMTIYMQELSTCARLHA